MGRDRDRGRLGVPSLHVGEPVGESQNLTSRGAIVTPEISVTQGSGSPTTLKYKKVGTSAIGEQHLNRRNSVTNKAQGIVPLDQHTKLSNVNIPSSSATTQRRFNTIKQQTPVLHVSNKVKAHPQQKQINNKIKSLFAKYPNLTETKTFQEEKVKTNPEIQNTPINPLSPTPNFVWYDSVEQDNHKHHLSSVVPDPYLTQTQGQERLPLSPPPHYLGRNYLGRWVTSDTPSRPDKPRWPAKTSYQPGFLTGRAAFKQITSSTTPSQVSKSKCSSQ